MPTMEELLAETVAKGASDLHLSAGQPPLLRIHGDLLRTEHPALGPEAVLTLVHTIMTDGQRAHFAAEHDVDFACELPGKGRFRVNVFLHSRGPGAVLRTIPTEIPSLDSLNLPPVLKELCTRERGLVLVTGPTGSGKSTTLAAMVDVINQTWDAHILTVEDPIEFVHPPKRCLVNQREVGPHTGSFTNALRSALREDPDVILIGEMRDLETVSAAIHFAETGHLVLGTLHANNANQAVERVMNFFPHEAHESLYGQLALNLRGIVSQRLVPRADGKGRVAAIEIMLNTPRIADLVAKGEMESLKAAIEQNALDGSQSFDQALYTLYRAGAISHDEALRQADSANNLRLKIRMEDAGAAGVAAAEAQGAAIPGPNAAPPAFTLKKKEDWAA